METNQNLLKAIKMMHTLVESDSVEKKRASQERLSGLFSKSREKTYENFHIGNIPAERVSVNRDHRKNHVILYCHGGGYNTGSFRYARSVTNKLADTTSMDVLSFDYRLAPEDPYPAAPEDAMQVWDYLTHSGYDAKDVIVAGDSAGGNLALSLLLKLKEQRRILPCGLILFSPWTNLTLSGASYQTIEGTDPILTKDYLAQAVRDYCGKRSEENLKDPLISPVYGDFEGFPPTYIQVGENEILLSDSLSLQRQMEKHHVQVQLDLYPGMWHVFQMSPFKTAHEAMEQAAAFIADCCNKP